MSEVIQMSDIIDGAIAAGIADHRSGVIDFQRGMEATPDKIQRYFDDAGWGWYLEPTGGKYTEKTLEGYQEWCGLAVANWLRRAGDYILDDRCVPVSLKRSIAYYVLPGTSRIIGDTKWREAGIDPRDVLRPDPADIQRGDVAILANDAGVPSHIVLATRGVDVDGYFRTIEGNAWGDLGGGVYGEGVVFRRHVQLTDHRGEPKTITPRHVDDVAAVVRPEPHMFDIGKHLSIEANV